MKKKITRIVSFWVSAVMVMSLFAVNAYARGIFDDAVTMEPLTFYNVKLDNEHKYYKITIPTDGKLLFRNAASNSNWLNTTITLRLLNANADVIGKSLGVDSNKSYEFTNLKRGTYYLNLFSGSKNNYINDIYYTFTPDDPNFQQNQTPATTVLRLTVTMNRGDTLEFGTTVGSDRARWQSSNRDVATVSSSGVVTARAVGTATIAANVNGSIVRIVVRVR